MRGMSTGSTSSPCRISRLERLDFLRRKWLLPCLRLRNLPLPVILKRFAVALCVFILGILLFSFPTSISVGDSFLNSTKCRQYVLSLPACAPIRSQVDS